jgi:A/G-specific adenine glycosylase
MDLGATVCTPRRPACAACPVRASCAARRLGIQEELPAKSKRKPLPHHQVAVGIIWKRGRILIAKRFARDLLGGLWEFPGGHQEKGESLEQCVAREVREELGIGVRVGEEYAVVEHGYSHFTITLHAYVCEWRRGTPRPIACAECKWVAPRQLTRYAFPSANRKIIARLVGDSKG